MPINYVGGLDGSEESFRFDLDTIRAATNDFSDENKLGQGGFGAVYKVSTNYHLIKINTPFQGKS